MQTIVEQIEQLNDELQILTKEYESMIERLNELIAVEGEPND
jgi:acetolactate synthase small subunit